MKLRGTYSKEGDTAYIDFGKEREVVATSALSMEPWSSDGLSVDFDGDGKIVGIEFVTASDLLDATVLDQDEYDQISGKTHVLSGASIVRAPWMEPQDAPEARSLLGRAASLLDARGQEPLLVEEIRTFLRERYGNDDRGR